MSEGWGGGWIVRVGSWICVLGMVMRVCYKIENAINYTIVNYTSDLTNGAWYGRQQAEFLFKLRLCLALLCSASSSSTSSSSSSAISPFPKPMRRLIIFPRGVWEGRTRPVAC